MDEARKTPLPAAVPHSHDTAAFPAGGPRVVSSDLLFRGDVQLGIRHDETLYILRRTRFGKLILTK